MPDYKARCNDCGWEHEFSAETPEEAQSMMYAEHDSKRRASGNLYCPGDSFKLETPGKTYRIRSGGALELIADTTRSAPPPISLEDLDQDLFPLRDFLLHAAARYEEKGYGTARVSGTARECQTEKAVADDYSVDKTILNWRVERVKGGWKILASGLHSYDDHRGSMYSDSSSVEFEIELTDQEARNPEAVLDKMPI